MDITMGWVSRSEQIEASVRKWIHNVSEGLAILSRGIAPRKKEVVISEVFPWFVFAVIVYLVWGGFRSVWLDEGIGDRLGVGDIPLRQSGPFVVVFFLSSAVVARSFVGALWFLGATCTLSIIPAIPKLPFIREYGHIIIWAVLVKLGIQYVQRRSAYKVSWARNALSEPVVTLLALFVAQGVLSLGINYLRYGSVLAFKLGVAELILYSSLVALLYVLVHGSDFINAEYRLLFQGLKMASFLSIVIGVSSVVVMYGNGTVAGNDSALGLGYWTRLKGTFAGPVHAGVFYAASIPVILHLASRQVEERRINPVLAVVVLSTLAILIIATGSRTARIAALVPLAVGLIYAPYRRITLKALPAFIISYSYGFYFRSLLGVLNVYFGDGSLAHENVQYVFWEDPIRVKLVTEATTSWLEDTIAIIFGFGPGVAGYTASGFPGPHMTVLDIASEQGIIGLLLVSGAVGSVVSRLLRNLLSSRGELQSASVAMLLALVVITIGGLAFDNHTWVYVWYFFLCAVVVARHAPSTFRTTSEASRA